MPSGPLNYTTAIPAARTTGECLALLAEAGAGAVAVTYADKVPSGLAFNLDTHVGPRSFTMPVNIDGVFAQLQKAHQDKRLKGSRGRTAESFVTRKHATDVAWRVIKDWLEAQLAIIAANMASLDQVMLPYLQVGPDTTLYQAFSRGNELTAGSAS